LPRPYAWAAAALVAGTALGAVLYALVDNSFARPHAQASPVMAATPAAPAPTAMSAAPTTPAGTGTPPGPAVPASAPVAEQTLHTSNPAPAALHASPAAATPSAAARETPAAAPPATAAAQPQPAKAEPPAATPRADRASAPSGRDIIANRVDAMNRLLKSDTAKPFSIQLLTTGNEEQLRNHLKAIAKFVEVNDIYMYRSVAQGRPAVSVLWGTFDDRQAAQDQIVDLPRPLRANRPYVRSIDEIRAEVDRNSVSR
jgi:septal ring-binding cell division protein DamX